MLIDRIVCFPDNVIVLPLKGFNVGVGEKRSQDVLELELQMVVNYPTYTLGTTLGSSTRAVCVYNC